MAAPTAPNPWAASLSPAPAGVEVAEAALALAALDRLEAAELTLAETEEAALEPLPAVVVAEEDPEPVVVALPVAAAVPLPLAEVLEQPAEAG